ISQDYLIQLLNQWLQILQHPKNSIFVVFKIGVAICVAVIRVATFKLVVCETVSPFKANKSFYIDYIIILNNRN
ncbi:MAG: hypothetical protein ACKPKO_54410, partial [Candidatus Fonsibacter sp.]